MVKQKKISAFKIIIFTFLTIWSLSLLYLLVWGLFTAVKDPLLDFRKNPLGFPAQWKFSNFSYVYNNFAIPFVVNGKPVSIGMPEQILNTLLFCVIRSFLGTFVPCFVGYLVAKYRYKFSSVLYGVALFVMALPIVGAYPAELALLKTLGVYDTVFGLILQSSGYLGLYFFVFTASFQVIPNDYYESACLDGASEFVVYFRIMLPMVFSTFATVLLLQFIANWNDYQYALLYWPSHPTLSYGLYVISNSPLQGLNNPPMRLAANVIVIIPILIVFIIFKDKIMSNISMGGLKE